MTEKTIDLDQHRGMAAPTDKALKTAFRPRNRRGLVTRTLAWPREFSQAGSAHAAVAARHVRKTSLRKARSVRRDVRWRWTLNVFWTTA
jgi:hypothetical protein